jgi:hypothetical protein
VCRCICEYEDVVRKSQWSSQKSVPAVEVAGTVSKVDAVKCFELCIINATLTNVNAFFIADKRGKCVCVCM